MAKQFAVLRYLRFATNVVSLHYTQTGELQVFDVRLLNNETLPV